MLRTWYSQFNPNQKLRNSLRKKYAQMTVLILESPLESSECHMDQELRLGCLVKLSYSLPAAEHLCVTNAVSS